VDICFVVNMSGAVWDSLIISGEVNNAQKVTTP